MLNSKNLTLKNNFTQIEIIDNSTKYKYLSDVYITDCTENQKMVAPNRAKVIKSDFFNIGDDVIYFNYNVYIFENNYFIQNDSIFFCNRKLTKPGIIVCKLRVDQQPSQYFKTRAIDWFVVQQSNLDWVKEGEVVIIRKFCCTEFNINNEQFFFIEPPHIHIIIKETGIYAGNHFLLLKNKIVTDKYLGYKTDIPNVGILESSEYFYDIKYLEITIKNNVYSLVNKKNVIQFQPL